VPAAVSSSSSSRLFALAAALLVVAACATGCGTTGPAKPAKLYPAWVVNPDLPGYTGVIGAAPPQDMGGRDAQYRVAMLKARQELARMIRVQVEARTTTSIEQRGGQATQDYDSEMRLRASQALQLDRARVVDEWVDPETGELYIHLVTPKQ